MGVLIAIIKLLPALITIVQCLETALPQAGVGVAKLTIAQEVLAAAYDETPEVAKDMPREKWITIAANLISKIVGIFNAHGIFKK